MVSRRSHTPLMSNSLGSKFLVSTLKPLFQFGKRHGWLSILLWLLMLAPAQAALMLRIAVKDGASQLKVGSSTQALVRDGTGRKLGTLNAMGSFVAKPQGGGIALNQLQSSQFWIDPSNNGYVYIGNRWYRGRVRLVRKGQGLLAINHVDLEEYLYSVLGSEVYTNWPMEALKAQAVSARSYALHKRQKTSNGLYDLGDTTTWQVYKGVEAEASTTQKAVQETAGQVLTHKGRIILAVFHASSGGHTENVEDVWSNPLPYLRGVPDFDQGTRHYRWEKIFSRSQLSKRISGVGNVVSFAPERLTPRGRIVTIKVLGDRGSRSLSGNDMRKALSLKSTRFVVSPEGANFRIEGGGFGHGVGMSQWGAYGMARRGYNYQQIVGHFYRGATLARIKVE